jgi:plasmid stabilization system protein ParE
LTAPAVLTPQARADLANALDWIADDNLDAARAMQAAVAEAARKIGERPLTGRMRLDLAPSPYRFWSLTRFQYLLVYRADVVPPRILRIVHTARDLQPLLADLDVSGD